MGQPRPLDGGLTTIEKSIFPLNKMLFELSPLALTDGDSFLKRRNMKKIFTSIILFIIVFCLGLSGCTGNGDVTDITPVDLSNGTTETQTDAVTQGKDTDAEDGEVNMWRYRQEKGIVVRDLVIETGKGGEDITVVQLTDLHLSWVTENDLADPIISKTYESRTWTKDGRFWNNAKKCLEWAKDYDQIVLTGDVYDYLSEGTVIKVKDYIFGNISSYHLRAYGRRLRRYAYLFLLLCAQGGGRGVG